MTRHAPHSGTSPLSALCSPLLVTHHLGPVPCGRCDKEGAPALAGCPTSAMETVSLPVPTCHHVGCSGAAFLFRELRLWKLLATPEDLSAGLPGPGLLSRPPGQPFPNVGRTPRPRPGGAGVFTGLRAGPGGHPSSAKRAWSRHPCFAKSSSCIVGPSVLLPLTRPVPAAVASMTGTRAGAQVPFGPCLCFQRPPVPSLSPRCTVCRS